MADTTGKGMNGKGRGTRRAAKAQTDGATPDRDEKGAGRTGAPKAPAGGTKRSRASTKAAAPSGAAKKTAATAKARAAKSKATSQAPVRKPATRRKAVPKPWLKSYPEQVPAEIPPFAYHSLGEMLVESCRRYGDRPAFTCMDKSLSFAELEKASTDFAAYLQSLGIKKGDRVAVMMPNVLQYPVVMMAVLRAGCVAVNVNPLYTPRELRHQLRDAGAETIVVLENFAHTVQKSIDDTSLRHVVVASMGDMLGLKGHIVNFVVRHIKKMVPSWDLPGHVPFNTAMKKGAEATFTPPKVDLDDLAFLQYTGGTTGVAKGAMLLHRNVLANTTQNELWHETAYINAPRPERLTLLCALPLYHIYALTVNALMGLKIGGHNVLIPNPRDIPALVKEIGKHDISIFPGLNTLFNALLDNDDFQKLDFRNLRMTFGGGMAVQRSVAERWKKLTGCMIAEGYGLSETSPVVAANRFDGEEFTGTIGLPFPSTEVVMRDDNSKDVALGEVGELCIRGPQVMAGYWNMPDETEAAIMKDGFFKSGDLGVMDEAGYIKIVDRKKDMIVVSGFKVYPNEVEDVVAEMPGVREVAAVGVPDEHSGEVPKIYVVKRDQSLTESDVLEHCRRELTGYKRPQYVEFRDELPKSNVGKILRRELR